LPDDKPEIEKDSETVRPGRSVSAVTSSFVITRVDSEFKQMFRSLRHRNFRIYFFGQLVSLSGTWMQNLALSWLVWSLTKSAFWLGVVEFANLIPVLLLALPGGSVADRLDRRKVLLTTQTAALVQATILAFLTLSHQIQLWQIIVLCALAGITIAFEVPSRQALIVNMVDRADLVNAISLNSSLFNGTRIIGPAVAAVIVRFSGVGICFAINAVSYLAAVLAVYLLKFEKSETKNAPSHSIWEGLRYAFGDKEVLRVLRLTCFFSLFGAQFTVLMPVVASDVLHKGVEGFGFLRSALALGSLTAALALASRGSQTMLRTGVGIASLFLGMFLILLGFSHNFLLSLAVSLILGFCMTFQLSGSHSLLQLSVPEELRGRLMSIWTITIMGMSPLGSLFIGWYASAFGAPSALFIGAAITVLSALIYLVFKK
jgi:MFS family permease